MGRKTSGGTAGGSGNLGGIVVDDNIVTVSAPNTNLTLNTSGTGEIQIFAPLEITNETQSTDTSSGALVLSGGMGIAGDLYLGGTINGGAGLNDTEIGTTIPAAGSFTTLSASGISTFAELAEVSPVKTSATGTVVHNFTESNTWYHTSITSNFTVNLTNVPTTNDRAYTVNLILNQGAAGYYANAFQIDGVAQTIRWVNYAPPVAQANSLDVQSFTLVRSGSAWAVIGAYQVTDNILDGSTAALAAPSAEYLSSVLKLTGKGLYYINTPNGGVRQVFCDLDTQAQDGTSGWMLVASWTNHSWTTATTSTRNVIGGASGSNAWSANFGDANMRYFRVTANNDVTSTLGASAAGGDWYYYFGTTPITWKEVWSWQNGNFNYINDTSGDPNGNRVSKFSSWPAATNGGTATDRISLRGFEHSYNIKFGYKTVQRWNNLSDGAGGGTQQINCNFWNGLRNDGVSLNFNFNGDGTLAIPPSGDTSTTAAHDCNVNQSKVGIDDTSAVFYYGTSATANMNANVATTTNYPVWFWIK